MKRFLLLALISGIFHPISLKAEHHKFFFKCEIPALKHQNQETNYYYFFINKRNNVGAWTTTQYTKHLISENDENFLPIKLPFGVSQEDSIILTEDPKEHNEYMIYTFKINYKNRNFLMNMLWQSKMNSMFNETMNSWKDDPSLPKRLRENARDEGGVGERDFTYEGKCVEASEEQQEIKVIKSELKNGNLMSLYN